MRKRAVKQSPKFSILIPFRTDGGSREQIFQWLLAYYRTCLPDAEIITCDDGGGEAINRSRMRNNCAAQATTGILLFLDADTLVDAQYIYQGVQAIRDGAPMVQYQNLYWLHEYRTESILREDPTAGFPAIDHAVDTEHFCADFPGLMFGMTRATYDLVGGFDDRMTGWGEEDPAFQCAIRGAIGEIARIPIVLYHMYHARGAECSTQTDAWQRNHAIYLEYAAIEQSGDSQAMIDYCQHRQPFVWSPPQPPQVTSRAALQFLAPDGKTADFFLPVCDGAASPVSVPRWVMYDHFFQRCVTAGVIQIIEPV